MRFIHTADLHIDSPLLGLERYEGAPVERMRSATRQAFRNVIELCLDSRAPLLLLAGDVFDEDWRDYNTGLFFIGELNRLRDVGTQVLMVRGNHDAASEVSRHLTLPPHARLLSAEEAETVVLDDLGVAVHGVSYSRREVTESLVPLFPPPVDGLTNVGLLHANVGAASGHGNYSPCRLDELAALGYDYWALGHMHERQVLSAEPCIAYSGVTQGRHAREPGPRGCLLVRASDSGLAVEPFDTDVVRWAELTVRPGVEVGSVEGLLAMIRDRLDQEARAAEGRLLAARVTIEGPFEGTAELYDDDRRQQLLAEIRAIPDHLGIDAWIEKVNLRTSPLVPLDELRRGEGVVAELLRRTAALMRDDDALPGIQEALRPLVERAGPQLREAGLDLTDPRVLRDLVAQAEVALTLHLQGHLSS